MILFPNVDNVSDWTRRVFAKEADSNFDIGQVPGAIPLSRRIRFGLISPEMVSNVSFGHNKLTFSYIYKDISDPASISQNSVHRSNFRV